MFSNCPLCIGPRIDVFYEDPWMWMGKLPEDTEKILVVVKRHTERPDNMESLHVQSILYTFYPDKQWHEGKGAHYHLIET